MIWKPIPGHPDYEVSNEGQVRSWKPWRGRAVPRLLVLTPNSKGYLTATLPSMGSSSQKVHRLICTVFHGPAPEGMEVRHLDGNKLNNRADNLTWGTREENRLDSYRHGTHPAVNLPTHCKRGHEFSAENTRVENRKDRRSGKRRLTRVCLTCQRVRMDKYLAARRGVA